MSLTKITNSMIEGAPLSILDFGALANGVNDDAAAFRSAVVVAAAAGRGTIVLPPGRTYLFNSAVTLCDNLTVIGYGAKITYGPGLAAINNAMFKNFTGTFVTPGTRTASKNVAFYGLEIDGANAGIAGSLIPNASMQGVMISVGGWTDGFGIDGFTVQDCFMHDFAGAAVLAFKSSNINISNNRFTNFLANVDLSIGSAVDFHEVTGAIVSSNIFTHTSSGLSWHGMVALDWDAGCKDISITGNIFKDMNNGDGISCEANNPAGGNMNGGVIDGNIIENCKGDGVHIQGCEDVVISNNIIRGSTTGGIGISCSNTTSFIVDGNSITGNYISGIWCNGGNLLRAIITNNRISGCVYADANYQGEGIFIYDTPTTDAHYIFIGSNYIKDVDGCGIYSAPRAVVSDNFVYNFARSNTPTRKWGIDAGGTVVNNRVVSLAYAIYGIASGDGYTVSGNSVTGTFSGGKYSGHYRKGYASTNYYDYARLESDADTQNIAVWASASPASGVWATGDIVNNTAPTSGGNIGWVCTAGGPTPTWKTFGTIA